MTMQRSTRQELAQIQAVLGPNTYINWIWACRALTNEENILRRYAEWRVKRYQRGL